MTLHYRNCPLCEATCGLSIETEGDRVVKIRGDEQDSFSRGYLCPKGVALQDLHEDPDRLRRPLRRTSKGFEEIDWPSALDEAASMLRGVQERHGDDSVAVYLGNPTVHNVGAMLFGPPLIRALHTRQRFSATSLDQLAHHLTAWAMYGHQLLIPIPDLERTRLFLVLGGNPVASNGSLMTVPDVRRRLLELKARGGKLVVVDPRRTETADIASEHHFIVPGTDVFLLLGMLQTLFSEGLTRPGALAQHTDGLAVVRAAVAGYTPERVAACTRVEAETIRRLARDLAAADGGIAYGRMGCSTQMHGGLCQWLIQILNLVTGNLDRPGGVLFTRPALDVMRAVSRGSFGRWRSRVRGLPEFGGELPTATLAEEMDTPGPGQIRGLLTHAGNPVLSAPNGRRLDAALAELEAFVAVDIYVNETTRHAHLILPPTGPLEHAHYDAAFHALSIRNVAKWSDAVFERAPDALHDYEILGGLTERMLALRGASLGQRATARMQRGLGPAKLVDLGLRAGPYGLRRGRRGLSVRALRAAPHGVDLGPLQSQLPDALQTKDGRIQAAPRIFMEALERLDLPEVTASDALSLIGRRELRTNNSWMHNAARLAGGRDRCTVWIHPDDAEKRGIRDGAQVRVTSRVGSVELAASVTDAIAPGVVSIPHGFGHNREGIRLSVAEKHAGVSINDLTDDQRVDELTGAVAYSGVPVTLTGI
ncbi:MAG TPA: molybdopterin-dependent oxidoreductase [Polyangiaceae bacterium]|nr:molybdopterin-dependent oxidoreductase [Polyangiaceae bacterium]